MKRLLLCLPVFLTARLVAASAGDLPVQLDTQAVIPADTFRVHRKQPFDAFALSALGTVGGGILVWKNTEGNNATAAGVALLVVGPALGHLYAGNLQGAAIGSGMRGVGLALAMGGGSLVLNQIGCEENCGGTGTGTPLLILGSTLFVGSTLYDVFDAPTAAHRYNRRHAMAVVPVVGAQQGVRLAVRL